MSAAGQEIETRTPAQVLVARVRQDDFKESVAMVLPPSVTLDRFMRIMTSALLANPDIAKLDHTSVLTAMVQSASAGLIPDGKEAAIVGRGGQAVFQPMIGGFRRIAAEHGWTLKTKAVYANDFFELVEEPEENVKHTPARPGVDRGELIGAYAKAIHKDGRVLYRVMYAADIAKRRAIATTQNVWNKWPAEMAEKTAGRDLFADLPLSESDLEREQIKRLLAVEELEPGEAAATFYGTERAETPALPPASTEEGQQVDGAATPPPAAPSTPGPAEPEPEPEVEYASDAERRLIFARARACSVDEAGLKAIFSAITEQTSSAKIPAEFVAEILDAIGEPPSAFQQPPLREEASA
jgi:recombination protein RecT